MILTETSAEETMVQKRQNKIAKLEEEAFREFEAKGLLQAYLSAVALQYLQELNREQGLTHLSEFLKKVQKCRVPKNVFNYFTQQLRGVVEFFRHGGLVMVTSDGEPKAFCPQKEWGKIGATPSGQLNGSFQASQLDVTLWRKGRYGYIPVDSKLFQEELRKPSKGAFEIK